MKVQNETSKSIVFQDGDGVLSLDDGVKGLRQVESRGAGLYNRLFRSGRPKGPFEAPEFPMEFGFKCSGRVFEKKFDSIEHFSD